MKIIDKIDSYLDILDCFDLRKGDMVYVSSELLRLMWLAKNNQERFDANALIDRLQEIVGIEGTILIPTYTFVFSNEGYYDYKNSKSVVGMLGNVALQRSDFKRTKHPMHSFAVWGKYQSVLYQMKNSNSFGDDSPFAFMLENHAKEIGIGLTYMKACTFIHYIETKAKVPYRFNKVFQGTYVSEEGNSEKRKYDYAARDYSISYTTKYDGLVDVLEKNDASYRLKVNGIDAYCVDMVKSYPAIWQDVTEGKCQTLFDFSIDRNFLYSDDFIICKE